MRFLPIGSRNIFPGMRIFGSYVNENPHFWLQTKKSNQRASDAIFLLSHHFMVEEKEWNNHEPEKSDTHPPHKIRPNERKRTMKILHRRGRESATCCWLSDFVFISVFFFLFLASFEGKWRIVAIFVFFSLCRSVHRDVERKRTEAISATVRRWQYFRAIC